MPVYQHNSLPKTAQILLIHGQRKVHGPAEVLVVKVQDQPQLQFFNRRTQKQVLLSQAVFASIFTQKIGNHLDYSSKVSLKIEYVTLWEFLYSFYNSKNKDEIRELCDKKIIEAQVVKKGEEDEMGQRYKPKV